MTLYTAASLIGYKLECLDGQLGNVSDFSFDDEHWTIRYLIADTGYWLNARLVLISPHALGPVMHNARKIFVHLTKKQVKESPSWDSDKPVSRQFEIDYHTYYGWPVYWGGMAMWVPPIDLPRNPESLDEQTDHLQHADPHLRSTNLVGEYHVHATDGEIGHIAEFIIDHSTWVIRYLVVGTKNWWPGKKIVISTRWIERVSWGDSEVYVNLPRQAIRESPEYIEESGVSRDYEVDLHRHYQRADYWTEGTPKGKSSLL